MSCLEIKWNCILWLSLSSVHLNILSIKGEKKLQRNWSSICIQIWIRWVWCDPPRVWSAIVWCDRLRCDVVRQGCYVVVQGYDRPPWEVPVLYFTKKSRLCTENYTFIKVMNNCVLYELLVSTNITNLVTDIFPWHTSTVGWFTEIRGSHFTISIHFWLHFSYRYLMVIGGGDFGWQMIREIAGNLHSKCRCQHAGLGARLTMGDIDMDKLRGEILVWEWRRQKCMRTIFVY